MALADLFFAAVGLSSVSAQAHVSPSGIRYRNGLLRAKVPAREVIAFSVGTGSGAPPPRIAYVVQRRGRRPLRLIGVQRWDSGSALEEMAREASRASQLLGLSSGGG